MADEKDFQDKLNELNNTPDTTDEYSEEDISSNKLMAILAYFSLLVLIPLFAAKSSPFARFHCNQGLILLIIEIAVRVLSIVLFLLPGFIFRLLDLLILILAIVGIYNAFNGRAKELPLIGGIRLLR